MNRHIPMAVCLTASILAGCTQKLQQPDTQSHPAALNGNVQPARLDVYAASPEVVRYDRYLLVDTSPSAAQRAPLEQTIDIRIPASLSPTVADAMRYALRQSGYRDTARFSLSIAGCNMHYRASDWRHSDVQFVHKKTAAASG